MTDDIFDIFDMMTLGLWVSMESGPCLQKHIKTYHHNLFAYSQRGISRVIHIIN